MSRVGKNPVSVPQGVEVSVNGQAVKVKGKLGELPPDTADLARRVLGRDRVLYERLRRLLALKVSARRLRCHGDYHLGQVLYTGNDFVGAVSVGSGRNVTLRDANTLTLANMQIAGDLRATAGDALTGSGDVKVDGSTTLNAGDDIALDSAGNDFGGAVSLTAANATLVDGDNILVRQYIERCLVHVRQVIASD